MQARARLGVLVVSLLAAGCFDSKKPPSTPPTVQTEIPASVPPQNEATEPHAPDRDLVDSSDPPSKPFDTASTPSIHTEADPTTQSHESDSAKADSSLKEMAASVGRVLFGQPDGESNSQAPAGDQTVEEGPLEADQERSILGAVGRALSKAAIEAAKQAPADE